MKISQQGINLIKEFEGLRLSPYQCSAKVWTIGYGHTAGVTKSTPKITKDEAENLLKLDLEKFESWVNKAIFVDHTTQNQFDALVSFCYNVGPSNFRKSSVLRNHNHKEFAKAAASFLLWTKAAGVVVKGLVKRRQAEQKLYLGA